MIKLTFDSRDKIFQQRFGSALEFPNELNLDTPFFDEIQPIGNVQCVSYGTHDMAEDQLKIEFNKTSIDDLWKRVPSTLQGSNPRDVLGEAVSNGLLPKGKTERLKLWKSYWRADIGNLDPFDNVRSALMLVNAPIGVGTYWYSEWHGTDILPLGKSPQNGHFYCIEGWKQINGQPYFIIEAWIGRKMYMSREVFNSALKPFGMQTWVLSTSEIDLRRAKSVVEMVKDLMINLIIKLRDLVKKEGEEPVVTIVTPIEPVVAVEPEPAKYDWDTPILARHSVRVICDEEGLDVEQKNTLCATVGAESGWKPGAIGKPNSNGSRDWGICQINDALWIGKDKSFLSTDFVLNNPEKCIRWMCYWWKKGKRNWWIAYKNGSYKNFL